MKTLQKQTSESGKGKSVYSVADSPASRSALPDSEEERRITATSGRKCCELSAKSSPLGWLVKTLLESSRWYSPARRLKWDVKPLFSERITEKEYCSGSNMSSKQSVQTLNVKDIPSNRCLFRLVPSEHRTEETGYGLLPTVQTQGLKVCNKEGKTEFIPLKLLPTPTSIDAGTGRMNKSKSKNAKKRPTIALAARIGLLPTPTSTDYKGTYRGEAVKKYGREYLLRCLPETMQRFGLLPTPMASDATMGSVIGKEDVFVMNQSGNFRKINRNGQNGSVGLARYIKLLPTPRANKVNDINMNSPALAQRNKGNLEEAIAKIIQQESPSPDGETSQLNPLFVAEMMGFPADWTVSPFLHGEENL